MKQQKREDVILLLNIQESVSMGQISLETYTGRIKFLKNKKYSGPLHKVDIFHLFHTNMTQSELEELKSIIGSDGNSQISNYKHLIQDGAFFRLLKLYSQKGMIYAMDKDYQKHRIDRFEDDILNTVLKTSKENNKKQKYALINTFKSSILYAENKIYRFPVVDKRVSITVDGQLEFIDNERNINVVYNVIPTPVLFIEWLNGKLTGNLVFRYEEINLPANVKDEFILRFNTRICRNKRIENAALVDLNEAGWLKSQNNSFLFDAKHFVFPESIGRLLDKGFTVLAENNKKFNYSNPVNIEFSYDMDWFAVSGTVEVSGKAYTLAELMAYRKKGRNWIELDDSNVILPEAVTDLLKISEHKANQLIIKKNNLGQLYNLVDSLNVDKIRNIEKLVDYSSIDLELPAQLRACLREYQAEGTKWLLYLYINGFGGCLADDMGLGKTLQAIALLSDRKIIKNNKSSLVVVPKTLIYNWKSEILKFNPALSINIYHGSDRKLDLSTLIITTYGTLLNDIEQLERHNFNLLILDEAQVIKNSGTKSHKAMKRIHASSTIALTGTPIENNIAELWSVMNLLNPGILGSRKEFIKSYSDISSDSVQERRLNNLIKPFLLRRLKKDVLSELPDKIEQDILCEMTDKQNDLYLAMLNYVREEIKRAPGRYEIKSNEIILQGLLYLRQICCHPRLLEPRLNVNNCAESGKFEQLKSIIENVVYSEEKIVIFSQFTKMLKIIGNWLKRKGWEYYYLDGETNHRIDLVSQFEKEEKGIFLISLKAGGLGINLTSAHYAVIYDPWWNPAVESQAMDRLYRIGQKNDVTIYKLITASTIEEKIQQLKEKKSEITNLVLSGKDISSTITKEMIEELLK